MDQQCFLSICSGPEGGEHIRSETEGRYYRKAAAHHVLFDMEGDSCRIRFDEKGLSYKRRGGLTYSLELVPGKESVTKMSTSYGVTELTCVTRFYDADISGDEIIIKIKYNIAGDKNEMEIRITSGSERK